MTESTKKTRRSTKPKTDTIVVDAVAESPIKSVTSPVDLRVVTKDFVVFILKAGQPRELNEHMAFAARVAASEKNIELQVS